MGNFAENLNLGNRFRLPWKVQYFQAPLFWLRPRRESTPSDSVPESKPPNQKFCEKALLGTKPNDQGNLVNLTNPPRFHQSHPLRNEFRNFINGTDNRNNIQNQIESAWQNLTRILFKGLYL